MDFGRSVGESMVLVEVKKGLEKVVALEPLGTLMQPCASLIKLVLPFE